MGHPPRVRNPPAVNGNPEGHPACSSVVLEATGRRRQDALCRRREGEKQGSELRSCTGGIFISFSLVEMPTLFFNLKRKKVTQIIVFLELSFSLASYTLYSSIVQAFSQM